MKVAGFRGQASFNLLALGLALAQKVLYFLFSHIQDRFSQIFKHGSCKFSWQSISYFWSCQFALLLGPFSSLFRLFWDSNLTQILGKELLIQLLSQRILFRIKMLLYNPGVSEVATDGRWELTAPSPSPPQKSTDGWSFYSIIYSTFSIFQLYLNVTLFSCG